MADPLQDVVLTETVTHKEISESTTVGTRSQGDSYILVPIGDGILFSDGTVISTTLNDGDSFTPTVVSHSYAVTWDIINITPVVPTTAISGSISIVAGISVIATSIETSMSSPYYDISIRADGDLDTGDFFDTTILTSIFTEKRADPDQVVVPERRRGWIGSHNEEFVLGNQAWVFGQLRNRQIEHNELASIYKASLEHLIDDNIAKKVSVTITVGDLGPTLSIRIERPNNKVDYRHFELWENTGA